MMLAHVYKQAFEYFPDNDFNMPIVIGINEGDMFTQIDCEDCSGTGKFPLSYEDEEQGCVCCKSTGKVWVTLY